MAKDFANKTIIFFDCEMDPIAKDSTDKIRAISYINKQEMLRAISEHGVHIVIIAKNINYLQWATVFKENVKRFKDLDDFLEYEKGLAKKTLLERLNE